MKTKRYFTKEQSEWLVKNYHTFSSYSELTCQFNSLFDDNRSIEAVREKCTKRLHLSGMPNPTSYGNKRKEQLPLGSIRVSQTGTYIKVKEVPVNTNISGYKKPYWVPLQEKVYSDKYGPVPKGNMICFLDKDRSNFNIENLYMIDRNISAIMSSNQFWSTDPEITKTAILWCKLHYAIKDVNN